MADEKKTFDFVVNDENILNSYGFRVMTAGIGLKQYNRNPLVLFYHKKSKPWVDSNHADEVPLPIGKSVKLWKDDGKLMATIEFDSGYDDKLADKIEGKVERGFINMCSLGADPIALSEEPKYMLPGQTRRTVTKCRLEEISIVDLGGNDNAIRLSKGQNIDDVIPLINLSKNNNMDNEFKQSVAEKLGLDPNSADGIILSALDNKITLAKSSGTFEAQFQALQKTVNENAEKQIIALVDLHVDKKFTADKKESMIALGKTSGIETLKNVIEMMPDTLKPTDIVIPGGAGDAGKDGTKTMTFAKLKDSGLPALEKFKTEKPQEYIALFKAEYGYEPAMD